MLKLFAPFGTLFGWMMYQIQNFTNNYGITLIVFTIFIKLLMVPLGVKQQKSVIANARMQPKMARLQKMYGNNRERYGMELQKLYQEEHFSPFSSCLPTLIMFPILFGMLDVIYYPLKHMLRMSAEEINKAVEIATSVLGEGNLNVYSNQISVLNAVKANPDAFISGLGAELTVKMQEFDFTMFGLPLGETPSLKPNGMEMGLYIALLLVPILSGLSAFMMSKLSMANTQSSADNAGMGASMNMMMYMMPLLSVYISFVVPAGVGIYWLLSNVLSLVQQLVLNKVMNPKEEIAKAEALAEEMRQAERQAKIEAKKRAREAAEQKGEDPAAVSEKEANRRKLAEARKRMAEKYGEEYVEPESSDVK
ncbi:MAG: membrane protein insertase YidC [Clostridia bacterium]|nr:membrane protein insertase YidC [Clostridia bacterium]